MKINKFLNPGSGILFFLLLLLLSRSGLIRNEISALSKNNISLVQDSSQFRAVISEQGKKLVIQEQTLVSQELATQLLKKEYKKLKEVKQQAIVRTITEIRDVMVPAVQSLETVEIDSSLFLKIPAAFLDSSKKFSLSAEVNELGLKINHLKIPNTTTVSYGLEKRGFFRKSLPVLVVSHSNPLIQTSALTNFVVDEKKPFYETRAFNFGVGFMAGSFLMK